MAKQQKTIKPEKPGGFLDFLPADYLARREILKIIEKVFISYGFNPIETPKIEFYKTLSGEQSDTGKQIFQIENSEEGEPLALAFDHTIPLARVIAENPYDSISKKGIELPWRRVVAGSVFRGEKSQSGRYRQLYQFDADIVGVSSMVADAEIVSLIYQTLIDLNLKDFVIKLNNRKILNGLAEVAGIQDRQKVSKDDIVKEIFRILDKIEKIGTEKIIQQLQQEPENEFSPMPNLSDEAIKKIKTYLTLEGNNQELLKQCREIFKGVTIAEEGIEELSQILKFLEVINIPQEFVKIDFSIARGLDYYTGPVMETFLTNASQFGSIASGGRYNNLLTRFTGKELPAVGASIGVDRLFAALDYLGLISREKTTLTNVMVLRLLKDKDEEYLKIANEIRNLGYNCELSLLSDTTFKSQFNYGIKKGVRYLVICGQEEFTNNTIQIKDTYTRKQEQIDRKKLSDFFNA